ncbi:aspartyl-phosphate phosphatase Spo0E family protein [Pelotomaculum propionicicum]|uniref:Spo0E like sporulation regulatory protein n=1 Tax=Pelotomaculum propionicicum TaxID=258475 RepID=A0A4Y7RXB2_9FIRM|nr:aspartyl-phosphate phosphatase Spo0E family protein [Pelotomaculum propionicicum]TEB13400.1 hypothetical protein Pmgp_00294 [Pelotomaculum propionicicum]
MPNIFKLNLRFKLAQARLIDMAMKYGLADPRAIAQSHKVDKLHTELQRRMAG